jgi:ubiquitin-activating enzyme E1
MARACKPGVYVPKKVKVVLDKNDKSVTQPKEEEPEEEEDDEVVLKQTVDALNVIAKDFKADSIQPINFDKDDYNNFHMDLIHSGANIRARCYRIEESTEIESKMWVGKIVPQICTTAGTISG